MVRKFRIIKNMRRLVDVTKTSDGKERVRVVSRLTPARKKASAYYGHGDKPSSRRHKNRSSDAKRINLKQSWERRSAGIKKVRRR